MFLSIVIPAYNEENRLLPTLEKIYSYLGSNNFDCEVIVVDDGSLDNTKDTALRSQLNNAGKLTVLQNGRNRGKGFSVKRGILASQGDYILFSDADLSTPIEEFEKLFKGVKEGFDIVIGSRGVFESDIRVHQPWHREKMGKIFNFFIKAFIFNNFSDTQCGFKLFKGSIARDIASSTVIEGFCFDVEMIYIAKMRRYKIKEIGVIWNNSPQSRVKIFGSSIGMFYDLLRIKALHKNYSDSKPA
ncbi:MAG: glycosyltransferase family 2 protein [Candidatus Omnitrophica bacterium]|nr:glycosyltransferase family 2 protein [Candidatus Omnitrophota bacterium]